MFPNLLIVLILQSVYGNLVENDKKCRFSETVDLSGGVETIDNKIQLNGYNYSPEEIEFYDYIVINGTKQNVDKHKRACICNLKFGKPCISLCCPLGQSKIMGQKGCVDRRYDIVVNSSVDGKMSQKIILNANDLNFVIHKPCELMALLDPEDNEEDAWYLDKNGNLKHFTDDIKYNYTQYCIANEIDKNYTYIRTYAIHCFEAAEPNIKHTVFSIGMLISVIFLFITFMVYVILPELRNLDGKLLMCYMASLGVSFILLAMIQLELIGNLSRTCTFVGFLLQTFIMMSFFWLNVISFDIWKTNIIGFASSSAVALSKRFRNYSIYVIGCSMLITIITIMMEYLVTPIHLKPGIGDVTCFLNPRFYSHLIYMYGPMGIILLVNTLFFCHVAVNFHLRFKLKGDEEGEGLTTSEKERFSVYVKLFITMGLLWIMELFSWIFEDSTVLFYITDIVNSLQGLIIFILFVCTKKVYKLLKEKFS